MTRPIQSRYREGVTGPVQSRYHEGVTGPVQSRYHEGGQVRSSPVIVKA